MPERDDYQKRYRQEYKSQAKRVNLTFTLAEHREMARGAKSAGMAVAAYVKQQALDRHHERADIPEEVLEQLADLDRVIRTIANNVNQMAHHSNRMREVLDSAQPFLHIQALETELRDAVAKIGKHAPALHTRTDQAGT